MLPPNSYSGETEMVSKRILPLALVGTVCLSLAGCKALDPDDPPYVISKPVSVAGSHAGFYNFAGVELTFYNKSDKTIQNITTQCIVYDADTKLNPCIGSNILKLKYSGAINPNESVPMIISLDKYLYVAPTKAFLIDFFFIASIEYSDGSFWEDENGAYYTKSY